MKVFTYFDPSSSPRQPGLLREWMVSWSRQGWTPRVLTPAVAFRHPGHADYFDRISRLPTLNERERENARYMRWLALEVCGGGWLADYDVINRGFKPRKGTRAVEMLGGVVWASKVGAPEITNLICKFNPRAMTHVSDTLIFKSWFVREKPKCAEFQTPGWEEAPLVHFSTSNCAGFADKVTAIRSMANA